MQLYWQSRLWYQVTKNLPPDTILKASTTAWSWQDVSDLPSTDSKGIQKIQTSAGPEVSLEEKRGKLEDGAWPLTYHAMISNPLHLLHSPCLDLLPLPLYSWLQSVLTNGSFPGSINLADTLTGLFLHVQLWCGVKLGGAKNKLANACKSFLKMRGLGLILRQKILLVLR